MTNLALIKRIEALEAVRGSGKPIFLWEPYDPTRSQQAAFDAQLAATKAEHPGRPVLVVGWQEGAA